MKNDTPSPHDPAALKPGLYLVGTPIGNLGDITVRALETLKAAQVVMAEDTRHTRILLDRHGIRTPMQSCHRFNEAARVDWIVQRIRNGEVVALVTDAGMPGVSDPGARVARGVREAGGYVTVVPGPSALTAALALSGMVDGPFRFAGFMDNRTAPRRRALAAWAEEPDPIVFFESPHRLLKLMVEIRETLGERPVFVGRELTKHFEELTWGAASEIEKTYASRAVKGELVVILGPAAKGKGRTKGLKARAHPNGSNRREAGA